VHCPCEDVSSTGPRSSLEGRSSIESYWRDANLHAQDDLSRLRDFHAAHFPNQDPPLLGDVHVSAEEDDGLGYYDDGVKRTLTDAQIQMFRHSEVQRLLQERRSRKEASEEEDMRSRTEQKPKEKVAKINKQLHNGRNHSGERLPKQFRFYDEPPAFDTPDTILVYDDDDREDEKSMSKPNKFLWPKLG
jgi:Protein of unknown function (DUF3807)